MAEKVVGLSEYKARARRDQKEIPTVMEVIDARCQQMDHPPELSQRLKEVVSELLRTEIRPFAFNTQLSISGSPEDIKAVETALNQVGAHAIARVETLNSLVLRLAIEKCELEYRSEAHNG